MTDKFPNHIAFIMDGNGRWATERGLTRVEGHREGAKAVRRITTYARKSGLRYLTLYAFSTENWARPKTEVAALMQLLARFIKSELPTLQENDIRLHVIGDMTALSGSLQKGLANAMKDTSGNKSMTLTLAINYGGRDEIVRAARKACERLISSGKAATDLDAAGLAAELDTGEIPDPDLVVRTAGEERISNFLVWQSAYSEFYFTAVCWPDFSESDFDQAVAEYARRTRKFGGL